MFNERLKQLRGTMSQQDLAKALNVSRGAVGMWESTNRIPNYKILIRIANYFEVSTDYLLGSDKSVVMRDDKKEIVNFVLNQSVSKEQFELFKMSLQLNAINLLKATCYTAGLLTSQN